MTRSGGNTPNAIFDYNGWSVRLPDAESKAYCYYLSAMEGTGGQKLGEISAGRLQKADQEMMEDRIPKMEKCREKQNFFF